MWLKNRIRKFSLYLLKKTHYPVIKDFHICQAIDREPITIVGEIMPIGFNTGKVRVVSKLDIEYPSKLEMPISKGICINGIWYRKAQPKESLKFENEFKGMKISNSG